MLPIRIVATGIALPEKTVSSVSLDHKLMLTEKTIERKSGIKQRYVANMHESQSGLAAKAVKSALQCRQIHADSVELLICASAVPEQALPATACRILSQLNLSGVPGFDVNASCISFLTSLHIAAHFLHTNTYKRIVIVSCDLPSRGLNWQDLQSAPIFGDGAAAVIVEKGDEACGCLSYLLESYPEGAEYCEIKAGGSRCNITTGMQHNDFLFKMDGKKVFRLASSVIEGFLTRLFSPLTFTHSQVDLVIPHQASHLSMQHIAARLGLPDDKVVNIYAQHGNQVSASLPTALHFAFSMNQIKPGQKILLIGTAAGFSIGGMVLSV